MLQHILIEFYDCLLPRNSPEQCVALVRKTNRLQRMKRHAELSPPPYFLPFWTRASRELLPKSIYEHVFTLAYTQSLLHVSPVYWPNEVKNCENWEIHFHNSSLRLIMFLYSILKKQKQSEVSWVVQQSTLWPAIVPATMEVSKLPDLSLRCRIVFPFLLFHSRNLILGHKVSS